MAYAAARCGLVEEALPLLHASCRMDLDDVNLDTERGVHVSGGAVQWCTLVHGFGGLDATAEGLTLRPRLPRAWKRRVFAVHWHFRRVEVEITRSDGVLARVAGETFFEPFTHRSSVGRTGRGDTTFAGYMAWRLGHPPAESLRFAAALVSIKMESRGPFAGTLEDVLARMGRRAG